jgi:hypothetical protein
MQLLQSSLIDWLSTPQPLCINTPTNDTCLNATGKTTNSNSQQLQQPITTPISTDHLEPEVDENRWKSTRQRKSTPIPSERSFTERSDISSVHSISATSHNQVQPTTATHVHQQQQQLFPDQPAQLFTNLIGQQQLQAFLGQPNYNQTNTTQPISFTDASTVFSLLQESLLTLPHSFVVLCSYNSNTSALTLQFQFVHQCLTEIFPEIINSIVDNLPDEDSSHNQTDEEHDDEINILCPACNSENPISHNYCGFCCHPTRNQSPTTFAIHTPQLSPRNNAEDPSS